MTTNEICYRLQAMATMCTFQDAVGHDLSHKEIGLYNEAKDLAIKSIRSHTWIPISQKVPDESGMYLVTGHWKNEPSEIWICEFMYLGEIKGWANDAKRPMVTAWMPLPKPYTGSN